MAIVDAASTLALFDGVCAGQRMRQYRADVGLNTVVVDVQAQSFTNQPRRCSILIQNSINLDIVNLAQGGIVYLRFPESNLACDVVFAFPLVVEFISKL